MKNIGLTCQDNIPLPPSGWGYDSGGLNQCTTCITQEPSFIGFQSIEILRLVLFNLNESYLESESRYETLIWIRPTIFEALRSYMEIGEYANLTPSEYVRLMVG